MMKKIFTYAAAAAALMIAASCSEETSYNKGVYEGGDAIALKLHMDNGIETKSDGVELENAVNSVQYFFYTDTTTTPVFTSARIENPTMTNNAYTISVTAGQNNFPDLNVLFPTNGAKVTVFGVFNYPETITAAPLQTVKGLAVQQHFAYYYKDPTIYTEERSGQVVIPDSMVGADPSNPVEKYFVMTGQKEIELNGTGNYAVKYTDEDVVEMRRLEAKFTFVVNVKNEIVNTSSTTKTEGDGESATTTATTVTETWTPILNENNVRIYLCNADSTAVLGAPDAAPTYSYNDPARFNYAPVIVSPESATSYTINSPEFYSYPMTWAKGESTEPFVKLIIPWKMEQTTKVGNADPVITYSTERELYYKVMFPETVINSNNHYQFTINVSLLGSEFADPTVTIPSQAQVLPWSSNNKVNPVISDAKYLSLEKAEVNKTFTQTVYEGNPTDFETIYTTGTTVGFAASDIVSIELIKVYQKNLSTGNTEYFVQNGTVNNSEITTYNSRNANPKKSTETTLTSEIINGWVKVDNDLKVIELYHVLNGDITSKNLDVTPYTYEVKVHLGANNTIPTYNDDSYTKYIKIIQYPQVYVEEKANSVGGTLGGVFVNGSQNTSTSWGRMSYETDSDWDYDWNEGWYQTYRYRGNGNNYNLGGVHGLTGDNTNKNMYVITVSVSDDYIIGDPRSTTEMASVYIYERSWSTSLEDITSSLWQDGYSTYATGDKNKLSHYHAANGADEYKKMIAPKIRIASSYGVCTTGRSEDEAVYRCASYQEDGYPAGRWRVPTLAEVQFISTLSTLGRIPYLFGLNSTTTSSDSYYRTASGWVHVNNYTGNVRNNSNQTVKGPIAEEWTRNTPTSGVSRCVYDEWFWGDEQITNKDRFTWGDEQY